MIEYKKIVCSKFSFCWFKKNNSTDQTAWMCRNHLLTCLIYIDLKFSFIHIPMAKVTDIEI